jgi:hypothetical protein
MVFAVSETVLQDRGGLNPAGAPLMKPEKLFDERSQLPL